MSRDGQPPRDELDDNAVDAGAGASRPNTSSESSTSGKPDNVADQTDAAGIFKPADEQLGAQPDLPDNLAETQGRSSSELADAPDETSKSASEPSGGTKGGPQPSLGLGTKQSPEDDLSSGAYYDDPYDEEYERANGTDGAGSETKALTNAGAIPPPPDDDDWDTDEEGMTRMSFLEHLEELRTRIIQSAIGLVSAYLVCLIFAKQLFAYVRGPIQRSFDLLNEMHGFEPPLHLVAITPQEQFHLIYLKVPLLAAVFVAAPWLVYQAWAFIAPGLYQRERRWAKPFIFCIAGLFVLGGLFGYFVVLKFALTFLLGIGIDSDIRPMISVSSYFSTFVLIELGLGIVFQMPVLIFFLTLLRIVDPTFLLGNVRYAILIIFVVAAVVTPTPDVFNMILFAAPMILLFYVGIGASFLLVMKRNRGKVPWARIVLMTLAILVGLGAATLYFMHSQLGYEFANKFPWIVSPPE